MKVDEWLMNDWWTTDERLINNWLMTIYLWLGGFDDVRTYGSTEGQRWLLSPENAGRVKMALLGGGGGSEKLLNFHHLQIMKNIISLI